MIFTSLIQSLTGKYDRGSTPRGSSPSSISSGESFGESLGEEGSDFSDETDSDDEEYFPGQKPLKEDETWYSEKEEVYLKKLTVTNKTTISLLEDELKEFNKQAVPLRFRVLNSNISLKNKTTIIQRIDQYNELDNNDGEYHKLHTWLDGLENIPFDKKSKLPICLEDGPQRIKKYLYEVNECLEQSVYGHSDAKLQILQVVAKWISNPNSNGNIIGLCGPMGNGKTTLAKRGIAKAINKPFSLIALGGAQDSSFLEGHDYTYEGSKCGRIVEILKEAKINDPVIFFDELDKVSATSKGQEIFNLLCHLTDSSQNDKFHDRYYSGIDFDLSKALMIFSFNDEKKINPILKDRITIIRMKGFQSKDKIKIATNYLLKELFEEYNFKEGEVTFSEEVLNHIINKYTKEEGVRTLKKCLDTILSKINILRLTKYSVVDNTSVEKKESVVVPPNETDSPVENSDKIVEKAIAPLVEVIKPKKTKRRIKLNIITDKIPPPKMETFIKIPLKNFTLPIVITAKIADMLIIKNPSIPLSVHMMYL